MTGILDRPDGILTALGNALAETSGLDIGVTISRPPGGGVVTVTYDARLELRASRKIDVNEIALRHAGDPAAFIVELIDSELKPFGQRLLAGGRAAAAAFDDEVRL